jgi:hypothetical protein
MRRRDVGRHRQGAAFGFARSRGRSEPAVRARLNRGPGLTRRSSPPPQGGVSRVSRLPVPGATIGAPPGILAAASPVPAHSRVRAQALKGSDRQRSRPEARGQEPKAPRRGAVPDPPIRVRALPSDTVRANHPGRADTDTRPALPSQGVTRKPLFDSATALPASPRGIWRAWLEAGKPNGGRDRD